MNRISALVLGSFLILSVPTAQAQPVAEDFYDPEEMAKSRAALKKGVGGKTQLFLMADRLEYQGGQRDSLLWDVQGWYGGDIHKIWIKSEGDYSLGANQIEEAEVQLLYSRAISPFFDLQTGIRQDLGSGDKPTGAVLGIQGLAPYWFEIDAAAYVSNEGDFTAGIEVEYELLLTQRLILQPRAGLDIAFQDIESLGIGSGLSQVEVGARLRYEIKRELAPYIGISWNQALGGTADYARAEGDDTESVSIVTGLRLWF